MVLHLLREGYDVVVLDNFANGWHEVVTRISNLVGKDIQLIEGDIRSSGCVANILSSFKVEAVIHLAGLKAVAESALLPLEYYEVNVSGTINLLKCMEQAGVNRLVFSSSATVYGQKNSYPYVESQRLGEPSSCYGRSKVMCEQIISDLAQSWPALSAISLRYFNPIGADKSGVIGEDPKGLPQNLMPFITQVAIGKREKLRVFGSDYNTPDGSCRRDYIHVSDLAVGHVKALSFLNKQGVKVYNLGSGHPISVLEMLAVFERVTGVAIPYELSERRDGDIPEFWADPSKANRELRWKADLTLENMIRDAWNWQLKNPDGYIE